MAADTTMVLAVAPTGESRLVPAADSSLWRSRGASIQPPPSPGYPQPGAVAGSMARTALGPLTGMLPTAGGIPGAIGGGALGGAMFGPIGATVGALGGAFAGGYGGDAARRGLIGQPQSLGGSALEGGKQAAFAALGEVPGIAANMAGRGLRLAAARISPAMAEQFPQIIDKFLATRLPVSPVGAAEAVASRQSAGRAERVLLNRAGARGVQANAATDFAPALDKLSAGMASQPVDAADQKALEAFKKEFIAKRPEPMKPLEVKKLVQKSDQMSSPVKKAVAAGMLPGAEQSTQGSAADAVGNAARKWLRENVRGWEDAAAKTRDAIGIARVLRRAANPAQKAVPIPYLPPLLTHSAIPPFMRSQTNVGNLGLLMTDPWFQMAVRRSPQLLGLLMQPPDSTQGRIR